MELRGIIWRCEGNYNAQKSSYVFKTASSGSNSQCSTEQLSLIMSIYFASYPGFSAHTVFPETTAILPMVFQQINLKAARGYLHELQWLRYKHPQLWVEEWERRMGDSPTKTGLCQAKPFQESVEGTNLSPRHGHWSGWGWLAGCCGGSSCSKARCAVPSTLGKNLRLG